MKPVKFKQQNLVMGENQPEYLPLPVYKSSDGIVVSCYRLTFWERIKTLFRGKVYVALHTFNQPVQPQKATVSFEEIGLPNCQDIAVAENFEGAMAFIKNK